MQKILITLYKEYWERKNNNSHNLSLLCEQREHNSKWGLGLAPTRQTQKEQYAYPDVTSPNRLHSDLDVGNVFRGTRKKRKEAKEKKEYVYRYNIYIIISYIIYYIILYIIIFIYIILLYILLYIISNIIYYYIYLYIFSFVTFLLAHQKHFPNLIL